MYLPRLLDLFALFSLFMQAFLAWLFVITLWLLRERQLKGGAYGKFLRAFVLLACALTIMSVRFFPTQDPTAAERGWQDGMLIPTLCHSAYMGLKAGFGFLLVRGSRLFAGLEDSALLRRLQWPAIISMSATPFFIEGVNDLLLLQAPFMIACSVAASSALGPVHSYESGARIMRWSLSAMAAAWCIHGTLVLLNKHWQEFNLLSLNSLIDLGVQVTLGVGLIVSAIQDAHRRTLQAEQEREHLRQELERDEKLRALGTVVSGVAHELNNPLTVILGYAEVLQQEAPADRSAAIIRDQAERCRGIVRNLSALAGQSVHPQEEVDVRNLVQRVVRGISAKYTHDGRRAVVVIQEGLLYRADRIGLEQVVANLVVNGLQASPPGGVVTVRGIALEAGLELCFADSGPGVPESLRDRLFEPFFTTKSPGEGTGLGLSIVHAIVRSHGGTITVGEHRKDSGAVFRVFLPFHHRARAGKSVTNSARSLDTGRLLIIDDDQAVRAVIRAQAERRGWKVHEVSSVEQALSAPLEEYAAILCDLRMSGIGGIGLHDRLETEQPIVLKRVTFVTGDLASPDTVRFSQRCARPLLQKPFDFEELFALLRS